MSFARGEIACCFVTGLRSAGERTILGSRCSISQLASTTPPFNATRWGCGTKTVQCPRTEGAAHVLRFCPKPWRNRRPLSERIVKRALSRKVPMDVSPKAQIKARSEKEAARNTARSQSSDDNPMGSVDRFKPEGNARASEHQLWCQSQKRAPRPDNKMRMFRVEETDPQGKP